MPRDRGGDLEDVLTAAAAAAVALEKSVMRMHDTEVCSASADTQVWVSLRAKLAALHELQVKATETTQLVNDLQQQWDDLEDALAQQADEDQIDDDQEDEKRKLRDKLVEALDRLHEESAQEKK